MQFSKKTVLALAPFLASSATAAPHAMPQNNADGLTSRNPLAVLEGFNLAAGLITSIVDLTEGAGDADAEESAPRNLSQIEDRGTQAVCISGEKQVNPEWFRNVFRGMCADVLDFGPDDETAPTTGKYENMASVIQKHTADWGQEIEFEIAWTYKGGVPDLEGSNSLFTLELCEKMVNEVGSQCAPSEHDGEPQTQGARPVTWNNEILLILDVTEI